MYTIYSSENEEILPGIPEVTEEMPFPENDQQMASQVVTHETAPPDITLEIVSPKLYTAQPISENGKS